MYNYTIQSPQHSLQLKWPMRAGSAGADDEMLAYAIILEYTRRAGGPRLVSELVSEGASMEIMESGISVGILGVLWVTRIHPQGRWPPVWFLNS